MLSQDQDVTNTKETTLYTNACIENRRGFNVKSDAKLISKRALLKPEEQSRKTTRKQPPKLSKPTKKSLSKPTKKKHKYSANTNDSIEDSTNTDDS
jgi:hypothetical protein